MDILSLLNIYICGLTFHIALTCKPNIAFSSTSPEPELDGQIRLDCDVTLCDHGVQLQWRKWTLKPNGEKDKPIDLYYYNNDSDKGALDGTPDYDIKGRTTYGHLAGVHTLIINDLIIKDNGTWECVSTTPSDGLDVIITATSDDVMISPSEPPIVEGQTAKFQCRVSGVNPIPLVYWKVGGVRNDGGQSENTIVNDYWSVTNTIQLNFPNTGAVEVNCTVGEVGDIWGSATEDINVKEKAIVNNPSDDNDFDVKVDAILELVVEASGYKPRLQWKHGGININNGLLYDITKAESNTSATSTLKSKELLTPYTCENVTTYAGTYTCDATLEPPYNHSYNTSPIMRIQILYAPISSKNETIAGGLNMEDVVLSCSICASEPFEPTWLFNDQAVDTEIERLPNGSLLIPKTKEESFGIYTLTVKNEHGTSTCTVKLDRNENLDVIGLTGGAIAGIVIAVLIVLIAPILIFLFIKYQKNKKQDEEVDAYAESGNTGRSNNGVNVTNGDHTTTASPVYSEVNKDNKKKNPTKNAAAAPVYSEVNKNKTRKQNAEDPSRPVYSQVNKSGRPLPQLKPKSGSTNTGPVYSEVNKPKQGRLTPIENQSRGRGGGEYEDIGGKLLPPIKHTRHYDNAGQRNEQSGLHYADVDFLRQGNGTKQTHGTKNPAYEPTEYAQIDHRKSAGIVV